jgi:hypothetical protein
MAPPLKIVLPLWLVARAPDLNLDEKLSQATMPAAQPDWLTGTSPSGKSVLMVFTSNRELTQFVAKHTAEPAEYAKAELEAEQLLAVLDQCDGIEAVRINDRHNIILPPFQRWVQSHLLEPVAPQASRLDHLKDFERQVYSQNGEDGVIEAIFAEIGTTNRYFVEFGCEDARECNAANLVAQGWRGLWLDAGYESHDSAVPIHKEMVTAENIDGLLRKYQVPQSFDLLCIDIDGNDFWVWKQIAHRPRVVVIEYNAHYRPPLRGTIRYDPGFRWQGTNYYGATLQALAELGRMKGYTLVHCERAGINAFFIADEALPAGYVARSVESIFRPPNFFYLDVCWPRDKERMMIDPFAT